MLLQMLLADAASADRCRLGRSPSYPVGLFVDYHRDQEEKEDGARTVQATLPSIWSIAHDLAWPINVEVGGEDKTQVDRHDSCCTNADPSVGRPRVDSEFPVRCRVASSVQSPRLGPES